MNAALDAATKSLETAENRRLRLWTQTGRVIASRAVLAGVAADRDVRHAVVRAIADVPVNDVYAVADAVLRVIGGES